MKKIILYAAAALALVSCDKYLNQYPHNAVASDNLTEDDAEMLMTGVYNIAQYKPTFNGWALFDIIDETHATGTAYNETILIGKNAEGKAPSPKNSLPPTATPTPWPSWATIPTSSPPGTSADPT